MAGSRNYGYKQYRGGRRGDGVRGLLKGIVILLAILLAAALIFTLLLGDYVEFTDEGVRLNLPWGEGAEEPSDPGEMPLPTDPLVVVTPEPTAAPEPTPEPTAPPVFVLRAVEVTAAQLADGTAAEAVKAAGGNCLVVEMKNEYGRLNWPTEVKGTIGLPTSVAEEAAETLRELASADGLYLVARVNCFRDQTLANAGRGGPLVTRGGKVWYDRTGLRWVSPADEDVRTYLIDLFAELAELGFDEVLLECAGYPYYGETHVLATDGLRPEELSRPVETFWRELRDALAARDVKLSFLVTEEMITGEDVCSGINASLLARYAERVWVEPGSEGVDYEALLTEAGMEQTAQRLVLIGGSGEGSSAVMEPPAH